MVGNYIYITLVVIYVVWTSRNLHKEYDVPVLTLCFIILLSFIVGGILI